MSTNPLFPTGNSPVPPPSDSAPQSQSTGPSQNPAADLIRQKLERLYAEEPNAQEEIIEAEEVGPHRSKHQEFMYQLSTSGKSLAEIQTAWHNYYTNLPDNEKHEVWREFYDTNTPSQQHAQPVDSAYAYTPDTTSYTATPTQTPKPSPATAAHANWQPEPTPPAHPEPAEYSMQYEQTQTPQLAQPQPTTSPVTVAEHAPLPDKREPREIKQQLLDNINTGGKKLSAKHHVQSILFGLGFGALVVFITLFGFFNEIIIAPFIQPSRQVSATPIIVGTDGIAPSKQAEVIIPKINVEIPLDFSAKTANNKEIESALDKGVAHYPTTVLPGQKGNTAFFGHSSNNIFNPGKYKFAFVLLHELVPGDTFYLSYGGKVYAYQVYDKKVVSPSQVSVLRNVAGKTATATLITCDPPGTSRNRLVVWGEQVSPSPSDNIAASKTNTSDDSSEKLPGNGLTLWGRFINWARGD